MAARTLGGDGPGPLEVGHVIRRRCSRAVSRRFLPALLCPQQLRIAGSEL